MKRLGIALVTGVALAGCQSAGVAYEQQLSAVMASLPGKTLEHFEGRNPHMRGVRSHRSGDAYAFIYESDPVVSTVAMPAGGMMVARSTTSFCRITLRAKRIAQGDDPGSWQIIDAQAAGANC